MMMGTQVQPASSCSSCQCGASSSSLEPITDWQVAKDDLLMVAERTVNGTRDKTYGTPYVHHSRTAALWSTYLELPIEPEQVSVLMILDKVARSMEQNKPDNFVDIAGYAQVHAKVLADKLAEKGNA